MRTVRAKDFYEAIRLAVQGSLAWILPQAAWRPVAWLFGRVDAAVYRGRTRRHTSRIAATLDVSEPSARRIAIESRGNAYLERFQFLRDWRFGGWSPTIEVIGTQHLAYAQEKGAGVILWAGNFSFNDVVTKMAFSQIGAPFSQFSRPYHGFSGTRFGIRYLNAVKRRIEDRYLAERIMAPERKTPRAMNLIRKRLKQNRAVSIKVGYQGKRRARSAFLGTRLTLATGPLFLAETTGATLLPVFTLRTGVKHFEVTIGRPICVPRDDHGEPDYPEAIRTYAEQLAPFVKRDPAQWRGWRAETSVGMQQAKSVQARPRSMGWMGWSTRPLKTEFERNVRVLIRGEVRDVGLETWLRERANKAGVTGWVRCRSDGAVEAVFEGRHRAVEELVEASRTGFSQTVVSEVLVKPRGMKSNRQGFRIRKPAQVDTGNEPRP